VQHPRGALRRRAGFAHVQLGRRETARQNCEALRIASHHCSGVMAISSVYCVGRGSKRRRHAIVLWNHAPERLAPLPKIPPSMLITAFSKTETRLELPTITVEI
jgi:hypothetical protein